MTSKQAHFRLLNKVKRQALTNHPEHINKTFIELVRLGKIDATKIKTKKERVALSNSVSCSFAFTYFI